MASRAPAPRGDASRSDDGAQADAPEPDRSWSRRELYALAVTRGIAGRGRMDKGELLRALRAADR